MTALPSATGLPAEEGSQLRRLFLERALPVPSADFTALIADDAALALRKNDEREETARNAIMEWQGRLLLSDKSFSLDGAQVITDEDISYVVDFTYHAEDRRCIPKVEPFTGQPVGGPLEGLWQRDASKKFQEATTVWPRDGSGTVRPCGRCAHTGLVDCTHCDGTGAIPKTCEECRGTGSIGRADKFVGVEGVKGSAGVILRTEQCLRCSARGTISVHCESCNGHGRIRCADCTGTGEVFRYEELQLRVRLVHGTFTHVCYPAVNPKWLKAAGTVASTQELIEEEADGRSAFSRANDGLNPRWARYRVRTVPVTRARFVWRAKERELFLVEGKLRTSAPLPFLNTRRVAGLLGVVGLLAFALTWFYVVK